MKLGARTQASLEFTMESIFYKKMKPYPKQSQNNYENQCKQLNFSNKVTKWNYTAIRRTLNK